MAKAGRATDAMILARLLDGSLTVDARDGTAYSRGKELKQEYDMRERYKFVRIWFKGHRKKIAVHRLCWMAVNRACVPHGHNVHHKSKRWKNGYRDIELLSRAQHHHQTYGYWPAEDEDAAHEQWLAS